MMAKPIKTLEMHYPMIQFLIIIISVNTQVITQNRTLSLARYLGLSADNHLDRQNGCQ